MKEVIVTCGGDGGIRTEEVLGGSPIRWRWIALAGEHVGHFRIRPAGSISHGSRRRKCFIISNGSARI